MQDSRACRNLAVAYRATGTERGMLLDDISQTIGALVSHQYHGRVTAILGMLIEIGGIARNLSIGGRCVVISTAGDAVPCEVVGFRAGRTLAMPFGALTGIG